MAAKHKTYARLNDYGDLLIPVALLDKFIENCHIVSTNYVDGKDVISEVRSLNRVSIHTAEELDAALVQMALEGK